MQVAHTSNFKKSTTNTARGSSCHAVSKDVELQSKTHAESSDYHDVQVPMPSKPKPPLASSR